MQHLTPVGLSKDGKRLLLVSRLGRGVRRSGRHRLRAALRGENARLGQLEMKMESALRPRDIQARIRAGESPEDVAAAAQTTVEAIMPFAGPVLAERAHVAQSALKASVRRRSGETTTAGAHPRRGGRAATSASTRSTTRTSSGTPGAGRTAAGRWSATYAVGGQRTHRRVHPRPARPLRGRRERRRPDAHRRAARAGRRGRRHAPAAPPGARLSSVPSQDELPLGRRRHRAGPRPQGRGSRAAEPRTRPSTRRPTPPTPTGSRDAPTDADGRAARSTSRPPRPAAEEPATEPLERADDGSGDAGPGDRPERRAGRGEAGQRKRKGRSSVP